MYVRYKGVTSFGTQNHYDKDGRFQGKTIQINCEDQYFKKARELDNFFIHAFYENGWNINKNIPIQHKVMMNTAKVGYGKEYAKHLIN